MHFIYLLVLAAYASVATSTLYYDLQKKPNPSKEDLAAYARIEAAYDKAIGRWNNLAKRTPSQHIKIIYDPSFNDRAGSNRACSCTTFGPNADFQQEFVALHEIAHVLGVGGRPSWINNCQNGTVQFPRAQRIFKTWKGKNQDLKCDSHHFWPFGLNFVDEMDELSADANVELVDSFVYEGLQKD